MERKPIDEPIPRPWCEQRSGQARPIVLCAEMSKACGRGVQGFILDGSGILYKRSYKQRQPQRLHYCPFCGVKLLTGATT